MELSTFTPEQIKGRHYGCHNRPPFVETVWVQDGWQMQPLNAQHMTRIPLMVERSFCMAKDCQFTLTELGKVDPRCEGCARKASEK